MRRFTLAALCAWAAAAQTLVPPAEVPKVAGILEPRAGEKSRYCSVLYAQPKLNYSFRFRFAYSLQAPVRQTQVPGRTGNASL